MLLSDDHLLLHMRIGELEVSPFDPADLQPASIDVHLAPELRRYDTHPGLLPHPLDPLDLKRTYTLPETAPYIIQPGEFLLGSTAEKIRLSAGLAARVEGKSSLGRLGLAVHITAGFIDPGFEGTVTLELHNVSPRAILLTPGMPIGQLCVVKLSSPALRPYGSPGLRSRYQGQTGTIPSHGVDQAKQDSERPE